MTFLELEAVLSTSEHEWCPNKAKMNWRRATHYKDGQNHTARDWLEVVSTYLFPPLGHANKFLSYAGDFVCTLHMQIILSLGVKWSECKDLTPD